MRLLLLLSVLLTISSCSSNRIRLRKVDRTPKQVQLTQERSFSPRNESKEIQSPPTTVESTSPPNSVSADELEISNESQFTQAENNVTPEKEIVQNPEAEKKSSGKIWALSGGGAMILGTAMMLMVRYGTLSNLAGSIFLIVAALGFIALIIGLVLIIRDRQRKKRESTNEPDKKFHILELVLAILALLVALFLVLLLATAFSLWNEAISFAIAIVGIPLVCLAFFFWFRKIRQKRRR